jgi:hypothetical protein
MKTMAQFPAVLVLIGGLICSVGCAKIDPRPEAAAYFQQIGETFSMETDPAQRLARVDKISKDAIRLMFLFPADSQERSRINAWLTNEFSSAQAKAMVTKAIESSNDADLLFSHKVQTEIAVLQAKTAALKLATYLR